MGSTRPSMDAAKIRHLLTDLARVNAGYLRDGDYRNAVRERLATVDASPTADAEIEAADEASRPYAQLVETSTALAGIRLDPGAVPHVDLVVGEIRSDATFAGISTAVVAGRALADELGLPLRIVMVAHTTGGNSAAAAEAYLASRFPGIDARVLAREDLLAARFSPEDTWLATHWKTAHAVDVAVRGGRVDARRVAYLVQDYEPGFSPWSTEYAVAASTYHRGFQPIVNSAPLHAYLQEHQGLVIDPELVFAPDLDLDLLRRVASRRRSSETTRVLFYGRPSKHRNLYRLGVTALKIAARELAASGRQVEFISAGEQHGDTDLGSGHTLRSVGTLPWDDYFDLLASTNVVLSLQYSPHPSHPPFDAAISGAYAVTNEFGGTRAGLHERIAAVDAEPEALADAIVAAVHRDAAEGPGTFLDVAPGLLGGGLRTAVAAAAARLRAAAPERTTDR
jgi:hypothetical protein